PFTHYLFISSYLSSAFLYALSILLSPLSTLFPYTTLFRSSFFTTVKMSFFFAFPKMWPLVFGFERTLTSSFTKPTLEPIVANVLDRKSTRLNSSHVKISYAVFCLKKKKEKDTYKN